jgi:hypothetical protein
VVTVLTVKGIYENGRVRLLSPISVCGPVEVEVTFPAEADEQAQTSLWPLYGGEKARRQALEAFERIVGLLDDLTPEQQQAFNEAVTRHRPFLGPRDVDWTKESKPQ